MNCQINIDDCVTGPCMNGGTCVDGLRSYSCQCPVGYTGANCEHLINRCIGQPCKNAGTCVNTLTGYKCLCKPTYHGCRCTEGNHGKFCTCCILMHLFTKLNKHCEPGNSSFPFVLENAT